MTFSHTFLQIESPQTTVGKRILMEAPEIKNSRPAKKAKPAGEPQMVEVPPHDSFPLIMDDRSRANLSYATIIGMAILRSQIRRLTLLQIYKWISTNYSFYKPDDAGWKNRIQQGQEPKRNVLKLSSISVGIIGLTLGGVAGLQWRAGMLALINATPLYLGGRTNPPADWVALDRRRRGSGRALAYNSRPGRWRRRCPLPYL